jgi:SAM-dependent methyltransferase
MEPHLIDDLAYKERFYWWHRVRRYNLIRLLGPHLGGTSRVLEIGSGTGANLRALSSVCSQVVGLDLDVRALTFCHDLATVLADAVFPLPFEEGVFDAVVMLDVLEHVARPERLVREIERILRSGGVVVVMVPSGPELWSYWDEMHGHQRRYTKKTLLAEFGENWAVRSLEYSFSWMYPVVRSFRKVMERRGRAPGHSDFIEVPVPLNGLLTLAGRLEGKLQKVTAAPFGTTLSGLWVKGGAT